MDTSKEARAQSGWNLSDPKIVEQFPLEPGEQLIDQKRVPEDECRYLLTNQGNIFYLNRYGHVDRVVSLTWDEILQKSDADPYHS